MTPISVYSRKVDECMRPPQLKKTEKKSEMKKNLKQRRKTNACLGEATVTAALLYLFATRQLTQREDIRGS